MEALRELWAQSPDSATGFEVGQEWLGMEMDCKRWARLDRQEMADNRRDAMEPRADKGMDCKFQSADQGTQPETVSFRPSACTRVTG